MPTVGCLYDTGLFLSPFKLACQPYTPYLTTLAIGTLVLNLVA